MKFVLLSDNRLKVASTRRLKTVQNMHFIITLDYIFEYFLYSWIIYFCNHFRLFILGFWSTYHCLLQLLRIVSSFFEIFWMQADYETVLSWCCCLLSTCNKFWRNRIWFLTKAIKTLAIHYWTSKTKSISIFVISTMHKRV